ncbi:MAG: hypothetical protein AAF773_18585 [Cyanobacteria bacterium P01_D01_bin.115]
MKRFLGLLGSVGLVLAAPLAAEAARLSLVGSVKLSVAESPVEDARVTVTFHGHEMGIHEYTTQRRIRVRTDASGSFEAVVKVPDDRYIWTHATVEIDETDMSKAAIAQTLCQIDEQGGGYCSKSFNVNPLGSQ